MAGKPIKEAYNNLDIHRILRHFPAWSSAHQLYYSNTAKLLGPLMQAISTKTNLVDSIIEGTFNKKLPFGFSRHAYNYTTQEVPDTLDTYRGQYNYVGDIGDCNPAMFSIKGAEFELVEPVQKVTLTGQSMDTPTRLNKKCRLYAAMKNASVTSILSLHIVGANKSGDIMKETLVFNSSSVQETINEYDYILRIHAEGEFYVTNALDLGSAGGYHCVNSIAGFSKRITDMYGNFFDPEFYTEGHELFVYNSSAGTREDNWKMTLDLPEDESVTAFFVTAFFDIIALTDNNKLYAGKLTLDNYAEWCDFEQTNNNDAIVLDYDHNGEISVSINIDFVKEMHKAKYARLEVENDGKYYYIDGSGNFTESSDTWIDLSKISGKTRMFFDRQNEKAYQVVLRLDQTPEAFCAKTIVNNIPMYELNINTADIFYYNRDLICEGFGEHQKMIPFRYVFLTTNDGLLFSENVELVR